MLLGKYREMGDQERWGPVVEGDLRCEAHVHVFMAPKSSEEVAEGYRRKKLARSLKFLGTKEGG